MVSLLNTINTPEVLRLLDRKQLPQLANELRQFLVESVSKTGGHLSSNLGTVELTIALHYVFNTPYDRLVWDVGHQTYAHKILTERREAMKTLRMAGGISGFPNRAESAYDAFGTAHSSTSISAALGMSVAAKIDGSDRCAVAIIGDGAMSGGMAFEALNNAGAMNTNLLVILNDNDMSISRPVGALNNYFAKLMSGRFYSAMRRGSEKMLKGMPPVLEFAKRAEEHVKGMVTPGTLFEEFGFNYIGPIDGHDLDTLVTTLGNIRQLKGPQFLHVVTQKGKGYTHAEEDCLLYHGVGKFDPEQGIVTKPVQRNIEGQASKPTYTQVFGEWLCDMAEQDKRLVGITPAMCEGSGMVEFSKKFPQRYFDVGIAEQHALTFAAGLACEGYKPVVAIYSTFLQRAYDQLIHDIAIQNLPVLLAIDRAGLVGADGATHAGSFDLSFLRCIPNLTVMAPSDENECRQLLYTAYQLDTPTAVRYPRGYGPGVTSRKEMQALPLGKGEVRRVGSGVAILSFGSMLSPALDAADSLNATVANMRFVKPLDTELVLHLGREHALLVTVEENTIQGGAGSAVAECLQQHGMTNALLQLGLPDSFLEQGETEKMLAMCGLDATGIAASIRQKMSL
ncbi:MAG: 1-deoxy-D-xylulose-5-phosphate synthase [Candidatus Nitrotoga sp.]|nr:1-deoxy-D-xylulose-5-phosphate synthase [Candidatus Nitrotoga sp.]MDO9447649.1 1-deoxy-D-xylulose-5-phosphate synthase [Candidatus Nitrotoga sp.]MDP1636547.1 1-deoxy-D-xylulose-5-phosphate synthase [Candidatus Nitrotoga sp.]MDP1856378.1 1-deoxy-D-xylulose-5-phosphate synthase [Candidatus Nitrotoga sp.]MDP3497859.1 1-deoxy-D-xylulose-5-phosphate synthase [Candidatus Nitrotoga sp.]